TNTRVHVIGRKVFGTKIVSDITDYRYAQRQGGEVQMTAVDLTHHLADRCIRLAEHMNLPFAGSDLKMTHEVRIFDFEVTLSPGFTYYDQRTGHHVASSVASYLAYRSLVDLEACASPHQLIIHPTFNHPVHFCFYLGNS